MYNYIILYQLTYIACASTGTRASACIIHYMYYNTIVLLLCLHALVRVSALVPTNIRLLILLSTNLCLKKHYNTDCHRCQPFLRKRFSARQVTLTRTCAIIDT
jgi:hypothetical protein